MIRLTTLNEITGRETKIPYKQSLFPCGEVYVQLTDPNNIPTDFNRVTIKALLRSSNDFMEVLMLLDAFDRQTDSVSVPVVLDLGYMPYARQDRVCRPGESFSLEVFAKLLMQSYHWAEVRFEDLHSPIAFKMLGKYQKRMTVLTEVTQGVCFHEWQERTGISMKGKVIMAPDEGARLKALNVCGNSGASDLVTATKKRNEDGRIISTIDVHPDRINGQDIVVVDDICDGGGTFIALADAINESYTPNSISLWVTHGAFTKGKKALLQHYENVWAYNDWTL